MPARSSLRPLLGLALLIVLVGALTRGPLADVAGDVVGALEGAGPVGMAAFVGLYVVAAVLALPGGVLTSAAGFAWGLPVGLALSWTGAVLGASSAFGVARIARSRAEARLAGDPRVAAIDRAVADRGLGAVLLMRLSPVFPYNLTNYGLGLSRVRFRDYLVGSMIGMIPGGATYAWVGALAREATTDPGLTRTALGGVGLVATALVVGWIGRAARAELARER